MTPPAPRRARADLKTLILDAAAEVVDRDGLGVMSSTVTYKQVFDHLEAEHGIRVTRGSVHERIWSSQRDFQLDVLRRVAEWDARASTERTAEVLAELGEKGQAEGWDSWRVLTEMVRVGGEVNYEAADEDDLYFAWTGLTIAIAASVDPGSDEHAALALAVTESYESLTGDFMGIFAAVIDELGFRFRPDVVVSPDQALIVLTKLATALSEGISLRRRFDPDELPDLMMFTGEGAASISPVRWHPFSVGLLALLRLFLEVDPDRDPGSADG